MDLNRIIQDLKAERDVLAAAIEILREGMCPPPLAPVLKVADTRGIQMEGLTAKEVAVAAGAEGGGHAWARNICSSSSVLQ